jgi:hypothetical protein
MFVNGLWQELKEHSLWCDLYGNQDYQTSNGFDKHISDGQCCFVDVLEYIWNC